MPTHIWGTVIQHYRRQTWIHQGSWPDTSKPPSSDTGPKTTTLQAYSAFYPEGTEAEGCPVGNVELVTGYYDDTGTDNADIWEDVDQWKQWTEKEEVTSSEGSGYPKFLTLYVKEHYTSKTIHSQGYKNWECIPADVFGDLKDLLKYFSWGAQAQPDAASREPAEVR